MKKFGKGLLIFILLALATSGATMFVMSKVHKHSLETEFFKWFPALERKVKTEETSKDNDIVIEEETRAEDSVGTEEPAEQTEEETQTEE